MTAPTPRETADHADHIGDATTMIDHAELARKFEALAVDASAARNLDGAESMMVPVQTIYDLIVSRNALLSEIAALRGALEEAEKDASSWSRCAGEVVTIGESWKERFVQAERQRDEAVAHLKAMSHVAPRTFEVKAALAFLANQGADQ